MDNSPYMGALGINLRYSSYFLKTEVQNYFRAGVIDF